MNVSLTPQLEELIRKKMASGLYSSASEVVREALRLLDEHDRIRQLQLRDLRREVRRGFDQLDHGQSTPFDESTVDRIKVMGRQMLGARRRVKKAK